MAMEKLPECRNLLPELESESTAGDVKEEEILSTESVDHIKVYLRIRPATNDERTQGMDDGCISVESDRSVVLCAPTISQAFRNASHQSQRFTFTHVFPPETSQKQFFDGTVHSVVSEFVSGQNCLVFTYGVTNSGKTYTIQGHHQQDSAGILPRSLDVIFSRISGHHCTTGTLLKPVMFGHVARLTADQIKEEKKIKQTILSGTNRISGGDSSAAQQLFRSMSAQDVSQVDMDTTADARVNHTVSGELLESWPSVQSDESNVCFLLWVSFAEIYNELIFDLLDPSTSSRSTRPSTLQLRDGDGRPYISGLREVHVSSVEEAWQLVQIGRENQHIAATRLNRASSRSHSIFTLRLIQVVDVDQPKFARVASLSFCDLAGSERNPATGGCNERMKEAGNINLSLMTLGRCIEALRKNQARRDQSTAAAASRASIIVPFRNSRLTRLFQSFLCGEGRVIMITNVSPCANVFDETLHAVNYSAIATQVLVGPSAPTYPHTSNIVAIPAHPDKNRASVLGKHEAPGSKVTLEKKLKQEVAKTKDSIETVPEEDEDEYSSDEDTSESWNKERQILLDSIRKLQDALTEEQRSKVELETKIRKEVCEEMQKQLVRIESEYQENMRKHEEILEEKYDRKMEIYMEAVQKSCKRQRRDDDDYVPSVELHAAEVKLSKYAEEVNELKNTIADLKKELATARENIGKVSAERDVLAGRLTKAEFSASEAMHQEKLQARAEYAKLQKTIEELTSKLNDTEHRHEVTCRQLRREKTQLEQKLNAANQDQPPKSVSDESDKTSETRELEAALLKEQDTVRDLELRLKIAEDNTKAVDKTWAEDCKKLEAKCEEKSSELTRLCEKYDALESGMQETVKALEETKQSHAEAEEMLQTVGNELTDTQTQLKDAASLSESLREEINRLTTESKNIQTNFEAEITAKDTKCGKAEEMLQTVRNELTDTQTQLKDAASLSESLREEINRLTTESTNIQTNFEAEITAKDTKCEELKLEIESLKLQISSANSSEEEVSAMKHELSDVGDKLKQVVDEKSKAVDTLNDKVATITAQLQEAKDKLTFKVSEIDRLDKELEVERNVGCQLEEKVANCEKKLVESESDLCREREKYSALELSFQTLQGKLDVTENAQKTAEKEIAVHLSTISSYEVKMETTKAEVDAMKEQVQKCFESEKNLAQQLSSLSQQDEELLEKCKSQTSELAEKEEKLQTYKTSVDDLKKKVQEEEQKRNAALKDACSNEEVIAKMKLTITEQETTMQTQDQMLRERDEEVQSLNEKLAQVNADHDELESLNNQIQQKTNRISELEKALLTQDRALSRGDSELQSLKDKLAQVNSSHENQLETFNDQIRQKNSRIRELEKEVKKFEKSCECLKKDVCDTTSELKTSEHNLSEMKKELAKTKQELESLKSDETDVKSLAKQLHQREMELSDLRKELQVEQGKQQKHDQEMEKLKAGMEKEMSAWREKRDRLVSELEKSMSEKDKLILKKDEEIRRLNDGLKTGRSRREKHPSSEAGVEALEKKVEQLSRAASAKDQTIADMREQNIQLQHQICQLQQQGANGEDNRRSRNAPRKSRIPTTQRMPLRVTDGNADVSVGVLADGGVAVDLDETVGNNRRSTRRVVISKKTSSKIPEEEHTRASRSHRKRTASVLDATESTIAEETDRHPRGARQLRSRQY